MALKIVAFVLPLGLDTLAIAIALGLRDLSPWRPAFTFATFEGIMPIFGIVLARIVGLRFETAAVVMGGIILIGIGVHAIREAMLGEEGTEGVSFSSFEPRSYPVSPYRQMSSQSGFRSARQGCRLPRY